MAASYLADATEIADRKNMLDRIISCCQKQPMTAIELAKVIGTDRSVINSLLRTGLFIIEPSGIGKPQWRLRTVPTLVGHFRFKVPTFGEFIFVNDAMPYEAIITMITTNSAIRELHHDDTDSGLAFAAYAQSVGFTIAPL